MAALNMFSFLFCSLFCLVIAEEYTNKFDGIDVDKVLKSDRLLDNYFKCIMNRGPCTPAGAELKRNLPDALETDCSKCTQKQRDSSEQVVRFLIDNKSKMWKELEAKFDPSGKYRAREEKRRGQKLPS